jgi:FHA domain
MGPPATITDQQRGWRIADPVLRLRALETDEVYVLPDLRVCGEAIVGADAPSDLQLRDPSGLLSRRHARLAWDGHRWTIRDLGSKNGMWIHGVRRRSAELVPGLEIGLGGLTLLAESVDLIQLRAVAARMIGWSDDHRRDVDRALRALRDAALLRASLVLCGEGALAPIARRLHVETLGAERPFVTCRPGDRALELVHRAGDGTLCVSAADPPDDLPDAIGSLLGSASLARLVLCAPDARGASPLSAQLGPTAWIELPPLLARRAELPRILREAAEDAAGELDQPFAPLRADDLERLTAEPFEGLAEVHEAARRIVTLRTLGISAGAAQLGITHGALSRWARRRGFSA